MKQSKTSLPWKQRREVPTGVTEPFQIRFIPSDVSPLIHPTGDFFPGNILRNIQHSIERTQRGEFRYPKNPENGYLCMIRN